MGWATGHGSLVSTVLSCPEDPAVRGRLTECLETILNKAQEPPKSKKVQHSNAKNAVLFEAISLIIHHDRWVGRLRRRLHLVHAHMLLLTGTRLGGSRLVYAVHRPLLHPARVLPA